MNHKVDNIIRQFFNRELSKELQLRFKFWFVSSSREEKEETLEKLWDESPSVITEQTWQDLESSHRRIHNLDSDKNRRNLFVAVRKWSAVAAILAVSFSVSYYFLLRAKALEVPQFVEMFVPYGECKQIVLPDSTIAWINAGSTIIYPEKFTASTRLVYLSGEANFAVVKNPDKPFIVKTKHISIEALGTTFSVRAYPFTPYTSTALEEGSTRITANNTGATTILKPDERLVFTHLSGEMKVKPTDAALLAEWKNGLLVFEDAHFCEIIGMLERKYNIQINYLQRKFDGKSYFVKFNPNETLEETLDVLSKLIGDMQYKINKTSIYIY